MFIDATEELEILKPPSTGSLGIYVSNANVDPSILTQLQALDNALQAHHEMISDLPTRSETLFRAAVNQLLILLSYLQTDAPGKTENAWVAGVIRYLGEHMAEDISLEEMARHFFVSKYHLCHAFREHTGTSVFSYLNTKRIAQAQQHLEDGMPAGDAAELVGFRDYSVFYRAYRKITGESPSRTKGSAKRGRQQE